MYRMDVWSQAYGVMWVPGSNGGTEARTGAEIRDAKGPRAMDEGEADEASRQGGEGFDFDFEDSDLDGVASY